MHNTAESVFPPNSDSSECPGLVEVSTLEFLQAVLPEEGVKFVGLGRSGRGGIAHKAYESLEVMAKAITSYDAQNNLTVYHACAAYKAPSYEAMVNGEPKTKYRGQPNWFKAKSFWADIDCGADKAAEGKGYATKSEAAKVIVGFCRTHGFPDPMIVDSGGGIHCYWPLTRAIGPNIWCRMADEFKAALKAAGLLVDPTRTADLSSVLRPAGTHNRKPGRDVREVKVRTQPNPVDPEQFAAAVSRASEALGAVARARRHVAVAGLNDDLIAHLGPQVESSIHEVANHCAQVAAMRDTQGDVNYDHWRGVVGVIKHCVEGFDLALEWSERRAETGHSNTDVLTRYETWSSGPATCEFFQSCNPTGCEGCTHKGKIKSPIVLGRVMPKTADASKLVNRLVTWDPKASMPPKREFLIDGGLFPLSTVSTLAGLGGSMKSALAIMLALYGALGKSWNGWAVPEGQTLILSSEDDAEEFQRRVGGYANSRFASEDFSLIERRVHCLSLAGQGVRLSETRSGVPHLTAYVDEVVELIKGLNANGQPPVRLVVADHARLLIGGDLNASEHATVGMEACLKIALETGVAVVLLAHSPKSSASSDKRSEEFGINDVLGSGAFVDNSRFSAVMTKLAVNESQKHGLSADMAKEFLGLRIIKSNYSESGRVVYLKKISVPGWGVAYPEPVQLVPPQKSAPTSLVDRIVGAVTASPGRYTRSKLRAEAGADGIFKASDRKVRVATDEAIALGRLIERKATPQNVSAYGVRLRDLVLEPGAPHVV